MSLAVFAFSQVLMDAEVIGRLLLGAGKLHGFTNSILGATVVLLPAVLLGRPVCTWSLTWWNRNLSPNAKFLLRVESSISWEAAWIGGVLGVYSHWLMDAMMHRDAPALWPLSSTDTFGSWMSVGGINAVCIWSICLGGLLVVIARVTAEMRVRRTSAPR
jgi:hypothetical protein